MSEGIYGTHLTLRLGDILRRDALNDTAIINDFLVSLVHHINMRILTGPLIGREDGSLERQGCSGVVILYESHAAIHTYPFLGTAFVDIFSCKEFNIATVHMVISNFFGFYQVIEQTLLDRGIHWGTDVQHELEAWSNQR